MTRHHIKQTLSISTTVLLVGASLAAAIALAQGVKFLSVQSGSMAPVFHKGDLVVVNRVPKAEYGVGDVITFINPRNSKQTITHRIVEVQKINGHATGRVVTKGDANATNDTSIPTGSIVGRVDKSIPYVGYGFDFVRKPIGLLLLIYVPALIVVTAEMRRLIKHYKSQEPYIVPGFDPNTHRPAQPTVVSPAIKRTAKATAAAMVVAVGVSVPVVHAALVSTATLTNSSITTALPSANVLIYKVTFSPGNPNGNTNSSNGNSTDIAIDNSNPQSATTGNASASNNGNNGNVASGNASNSSTTNTNFSVSYGNSSSTNSSSAKQTVTLYNTTNQPINLAGWKLADNKTTQTITTGTVAAKSFFAYTWPSPNSIDKLNGRMGLGNAAGTGIDALSWGSDTTHLNPAFPSAANAISYTRKAPALDTNTASDWQ